MRIITQGYKGVAASPGIAIGRTVVHRTRGHYSEVHQTKVSSPSSEVKRFETAVQVSVGELETIRAQALDRRADANAAILLSQKMILQDANFADSIASRILRESLNAEFVLKGQADELIAMFESMDSDYMRQRAADIRDITNRVMGKLVGISHEVNLGNAHDVILVADDLHPSDIVQLDAEAVLGFVTDTGGRTSHTAIMARSRGIPAVVGTQDLSHNVSDGTLMIIDGEAGEVYLSPDENQLKAYEDRAREFHERQMALLRLTDEKSVTMDGHEVQIAANIEVPDDAVVAMNHGAQGIGLFRSEFLFMNRESLPSEDEQFMAYRRAAEILNGRSIIVRTLDIGGDKFVDYLDFPQEMNPFLGYRAIRVSLDRPELFKTQLRAILRASHFGEFKVMYPMIATLEELHQAKELLDCAKTELRNAAIPFDENLEQGIMIETPAAAIAADVFAPEVGFLSIGTNDLIQYTLACDRMNEQISYLYQPYHPSVLRLVKIVVDAAHRSGKWVGMCGEMAGDLAIVPVLLGLGLDELSVSPTSVLAIRELIRKSRQSAAIELATTALQQPTSQAVEELLRNFGGLEGS